jgi:RNA polymerase sigma factor (sigma-70 family)
MFQDTDTDEALVDLATAGDRQALEALLRRQQAWIYNLAFYMLHHRQDAEDATQEILVRVVTGLSSFRRASAFRTWAHRIAVNHVLDRKRSRPEAVVTGFDCYADYLDRAPDEDFPDGAQASPETALLVEEASISCTMGMLLCLDRQQRMAFLLGEMLETNDVIGAELLGTTRENFRQSLARARAKLSGFMRGRCGLVDPQSSCRCARKTQAFVRDRIVDPKRLQFAVGHGERNGTNGTRGAKGTTVEQEGRARAQALAAFQRATLEDLRGLYPWFEPPDVVEKLRKAMTSDTARALLDPDRSGGAA